MMEVTERDLMEGLNGIALSVQTYPAREPSPGYLGRAYLKIGNVMQVRNLRILEGKNGPFLQMPAYIDRNAEWHNVCWPDREFGKALQEAVFTVYRPGEENYMEWNRDAGRSRFDCSVRPVEEEQTDPDRTGRVSAYAGVQILGKDGRPAFTFRNMRLLSRENGSQWLSYPGVHTEQNGETQYLQFYRPADPRVEKLLYGVIHREYLEQTDPVLARVRDQDRREEQEVRGRQDEKDLPFWTQEQVQEVSRETGRRMQDRRQEVEPAL